MMPGKNPSEIPDEAIETLLKVNRSEEFWTRQRNAVLFRIRESHRRIWGVWMAVPALAGLMFLILARVHHSDIKASTEIPPASDWAMLENLDVLDNWSEAGEVQK